MLAIPNLYAVQTVSSAKAADALNKALPDTRIEPLNILLQINTSGEDNKSGLAPLSSSTPSEPSTSELPALAQHIISACPRLHLQGLMTIGSLDASLHAGEKPNEDFETLKRTRDVLQGVLGADPANKGKWGVQGRLLLSMGMSSDFEAALQAGSDIVRVGTSIFGSRPPKVQS